MSLEILQYSTIAISFAIFAFFAAKNSVFFVFFVAKNQLKL